MKEDQINEIILEIENLYGEVLEYASLEKESTLKIAAATMILKERDEISKLKRRLEIYEYKTAV